jgi:hypothetical protein
METNAHAPQEKTESEKKSHTWACSWTWRYKVALLQSVAAALPKAALKLREGKKLDGWMFS